MRKKLAFLICVLMLTGCANNDPPSAPAPSGDISATAEAENSAATAEAESITIQKDEAYYEQLKLNAGLSSDYPSPNLKSPVPSKVCYVSETDTLFYSDSSGLFQKNSGGTTMLSASEAMALTLHNGSLYYIVPENGGKFPMGMAYRLDLETGEECPIIAQNNISNILPLDETIYYIEQTVKDYGDGSYSIGSAHKKCGIDGSNPATDEDSIVAADEKYTVSYNFSEQTVTVFDRASSEALFTAGDIQNADEICVHNDKVYYIEYDYNHPEQNSIGVIDCKDGSVNKLTAKTADGENTFFFDYGFIGDDLFMFDSFFFYKVSGNSMTKYKTDAVYSAIYSGTDCLYGQNHDGTISRLKLTEENTVEGEVLEYEKTE